MHDDAHIESGFPNHNIASGEDYSPLSEVRAVFEAQSRMRGVREQTERRNRFWQGVVLITLTVVMIIQMYIAINYIYYTGIVIILVNLIVLLLDFRAMRRYRKETDKLWDSLHNTAPSAEKSCE